ncbi:MAG: hypothetical protein EZS28_042040, partial [Streblomastix strix]
MQISSIRVKDLPALNQNQSADPYVLLSIGEEKKQTKVIKNTLNADFDDEITLPFDPSKTQDREMKIE